MSSLNNDETIEAEKILRKRLHECTWGRYKGCAAGLAVGMGISLVTRSHWGYAVGGTVGTGYDYYAATQECRPLQHELDVFMEAKENGDDPMAALTKETKTSLKPSWMNKEETHKQHGDIKRQ